MFWRILVSMEILAGIEERFKRLRGVLDERSRRLSVLPERRIRRSGGGRKSAVALDPSLKTDLEELLESTTRGDPESPLRWTCRSVRNLEAELKSRGHSVSHQVVADLLHELEYSLQANRKTNEGASHPDRNAQFEYV